MKKYLGIDGGGSKTAFLLIDESGQVLASHSEGPAYYLEIGLDPMRALLARGIRAVLAATGVGVEEVSFTYVGVPAYGEDSELLPALDSAATPSLQKERYRCGNDAVCGWAGALAGDDGINIVAGTGSIAYGEFSGRSARAGGWGELFSDEGSAYWLAREGLRLFSRMSDGRATRGALYDKVREHFGLTLDLDLCAAIYGNTGVRRSELAALSKLVSESAAAGDVEARALFRLATDELAQMIEAVRRQLRVPDDVSLPVSYSGGVFQQRELLLLPLESKLTGGTRRYRFIAPRLPPAAGAAVHAAKLSGFPLGAAAIVALEERFSRSQEP